ncbi:MAG: hypothetical protein HC860_12725 [Alkalinema sp. RU_4_3]|nr:hypothetical protein [Alkalinema sp. RU_4_3]
MLPLITASTLITALDRAWAKRTDHSSNPALTETTRMLARAIASWCEVLNPAQRLYLIPWAKPNLSEQSEWAKLKILGHARSQRSRQITQNEAPMLH